MASKYSDKLQNKLIVIVGGSSGIGFAVAEACVEYGARVVVASSKQQNVDNAVARIQKVYPEAGEHIRGSRLDLSAEDIEAQIMSLFDFASGDGKYKVDHVVMTAGGMFRPSSLDRITPDDIDACYKIRMIGTVMLAKHATKYLNNRPTSSFTITSGVRDLKPFPGFAAIAPVGAALKSLARALANDMKPIRVNCVCPGPVRTEGFDRIAGDQSERVLESFRSKTFTNTLGTPEDLAECYVCSMKCNFMEGAEIYADGGHLLC